MPLFGPPDIEQLKDRKDLKGLTKALESHADSKIRQAAAIALGEIGGEKAFGALVSALNDDDKHVRASAAEGLGVLGDYRGVQPLLQRLEEGDEYSNSFSQALVAIFSAIEDAETQKDMMDKMLAVLGEKKGDLKVVAAKFVGLVAEKKIVDPLYILSVEEALLNALDQDNQYLQATAISSLASCLDNNDTNHLYALMAEKLCQQRILRQAPLRLTSLRLLLVGLDQIDDSEVRAALRNAFRSHVGDHRFEERLLCYQALAKIGDDADVRDLVMRLIADVNRNCQTAAAEALNRINPDLAQELLLQKIDTFTIASEQSSVTKTNWIGAIEVLCDLGQDWVVAPLEEIRKKTDFKGFLGRDFAERLEKIKQKG